MFTWEQWNTRPGFWEYRQEVAAASGTPVLLIKPDETVSHSRYGISLSHWITKSAHDKALPTAEVLANATVQN